MSEPLITWDTMEDVIASLSRDENGHFLPNPNRYTLSTIRDKIDYETWDERNAAELREPAQTLSDLLLSKEKTNSPSSDTMESLVSTVIKVLEPTRNHYLEQHEKAIKYLIATVDGFTPENCLLKNLNINDETKYVIEVDTVIAGSDEIKIVMTCPFGPLDDIDKMLELLDHRFIDADALMVIQKTIDSKKSLEMGRNYSDDLSDDAEVIHMDFGDAKNITRGFGALLANQAMTEGKVELANQMADAFHLERTEEGKKVLEESTKINLEQAELDNDPLLRAQRGLASLDTEAAEKEFEAQAKNAERIKAMRENGLDKIKDSPLNNPDMTPEQLNEWRLKQASTIISRMDAHLETGGRVNVADKFLMNCEADLNQLIPFKYNWSWSLYLTSCEHHWMPGEVELDRCVKEYHGRLPDGIKHLLARAYMLYLSRKRLFPESVLMNIYRLLSNPECRQYLLRQGMEAVQVNHAWIEINEALKVSHALINGKSIALGLKDDDEAFRTRHKLTMDNVKFMHNYASETTSTEGLAEFVKSFIILYTHTNWISPLISHYQVITGLEFNEVCQPLAQLLQRLNRDGISQFKFAQMFVAGVVEENPQINTEAFRVDLKKVLNQLIDTDLDLVQTLKAGENEYYDVNYISHYFKDQMLSLLDNSYVTNTPTGDCTRGQEFVAILEGIAPKIDMNAGLGTVSWDEDK